MYKKICNNVNIKRNTRLYIYFYQMIDRIK